jgi:hypothetical protein
MPLGIGAARQSPGTRLKSGAVGPRRENAWREQFLFRSFILAVSIVSMFYGRENDSVDDSRATNGWHRAARVDANENNLSRHVRRKRPFRFASPMLNPTSWYFLSSWHRRRDCAAAVVV